MAKKVCLSEFKAAIQTTPRIANGESYSSRDHACWECDQHRDQAQHQDRDALSHQVPPTHTVAGSQAKDEARPQQQGDIRKSVEVSESSELDSQPGIGFVDLFRRSVPYERVRGFPLTASDLHCINCLPKMGNPRNEITGEYLSGPSNTKKDMVSPSKATAEPRGLDKPLRTRSPPPLRNESPTPVRSVSWSTNQNCSECILQSPCCNESRKSRWQLEKERRQDEQFIRENPPPVSFSNLPEKIPSKIYHVESSSPHSPQLHPRETTQAASSSAWSVKPSVEPPETGQHTKSLGRKELKSTYLYNYSPDRRNRSRSPGNKGLFDMRVKCEMDVGTQTSTTSRCVKKPEDPCSNITCCIRINSQPSPRSLSSDPINQNSCWEISKTAKSPDWQTLESDKTLGYYHSSDREGLRQRQSPEEVGPCLTKTNLPDSHNALELDNSPSGLEPDFRCSKGLGLPSQGRNDSEGRLTGGLNSQEDKLNFKPINRMDVGFSGSPIFEGSDDDKARDSSSIDSKQSPRSLSSDSRLRRSPIKRKRFSNRSREAKNSDLEAFLSAKADIAQEVGPCLTKNKNLPDSGSASELGNSSYELEPDFRCSREMQLPSLGNNDAFIDVWRRTTSMDYTQSSEREGVGLRESPEVKPCLTKTYLPDSGSASEQDNSPSILEPDFRCSRGLQLPSLRRTDTFMNVWRSNPSRTGYQSPGRLTGGLYSQVEKLKSETIDRMDTVFSGSPIFEGSGEEEALDCNRNTNFAKKAGRQTFLSTKSLEYSHSSDGGGLRQRQSREGVGTYLPKSDSASELGNISYELEPDFRETELPSLGDKDTMDFWRRKTPPKCSYCSDREGLSQREGSREIGPCLTKIYLADSCNALELDDSPSEVEMENSSNELEPDYRCSRGLWLPSLESNDTFMDAWRKKIPWAGYQSAAHLPGGLYSQVDKLKFKPIDRMDAGLSRSAIFDGSGEEETRERTHYFANEFDRLSQPERMQDIELRIGQLRSLQATSDRAFHQHYREHEPVYRQVLTMGIKTRCPMGDLQCPAVSNETYLGHMLSHHLYKRGLELSELFSGDRLLVFFNPRSYEIGRNACISVIVYGGVRNNPATLPGRRFMSTENMQLPPDFAWCSEHLPLFVMICRDRRSAVDGRKVRFDDNRGIEEHDDVLALWLLSIDLPQPMYVMMTVMNRRLDATRTSIMQVRSLHDSQNCLNFMRSSRHYMRLSEQDLCVLTSSYTEPIYMEVSVKEYAGTSHPREPTKG